MSEQNQDAGKKLQKLAQWLRWGFMNRRAGSAATSKVFLEAVRDQYPKDRDTLQRELQKASHPEVPPPPAPSEAHDSKADEKTERKEQ